MCCILVFAGTNLVTEGEPQGITDVSAELCPASERLFASEASCPGFQSAGASTACHVVWTPQLCGLLPRFSLIIALSNLFCSVHVTCILHHLPVVYTRFRAWRPQRLNKLLLTEPLHACELPDTYHLAGWAGHLHGGPHR